MKKIRVSRSRVEYMSRVSGVPVGVFERTHEVVPDSDMPPARDMHTAMQAARDCTQYTRDEACGCCDRRCLKDGWPGRIVCLRDCLDCKSAEAGDTES